MSEERLEKLKNFPLTGGEIMGVTWREEVGLPDIPSLGMRIEDSGSYYRIEMKLHPTEQSNITVVVCLPEPENWNGNFLGTGNGGFAGSISEVALLGGVSRRYAVANTDLGTSPDPDDCIGMPEVWADFGYRATHLMTTVGKQAASYFYGKAPAQSYFLGGSTGGQQGLSEAQRYPEDYDGIVCLSPAFDRVRLHTFFIWNWQQIHSREQATFTPEQAKAWKDKMVELYGGLCGSHRDDPFLAYPTRIRANPMDDPKVQAAAEKLLTADQREALCALYAGPRDPVTGARIIASFLPGTEAEGLSLVDLTNKDLFAHDFFYPFRWIWGKEFDFMKFDFHEGLQDALEKLSPVLDATDPDLSAFKARGGKLLVIGGSSDAIVPYTGFLNYYQKVVAQQGGLDETKKFFRFLLMPGFGHTVGGPGVQEVGNLGIDIVPRDPDHDVVCALVRWVEQGIAPERLLGTCFGRDASGLTFGCARPGYVYPNIAELTGGDPKNPENYRPTEDTSAYDSGELSG